MNGFGGRSLRRVIAGAALTLAMAACGGGGVVAPTAPTNVTATPGPGYIKVEWAHSGSNVSAFQVHREGGPTVAQAGPYATVDAQARAFIDSDVVPGETYTYSVLATGSGGASEAASQAGPSVAVQPGVDLVLGRDNGLSTTSTFIGLYLFLNQDEWPESGSAYQATVRHEGGWSHTFDLTRANFASGFYITGVTGNQDAGEYTVELTIGVTTYTATTQYDPTNALGIPAAVAATYSAAGTLSVTWEPVPGAVNYAVVLYDARSVTIGDRSIVSQPSTQIAGLNLDPGAYWVRVSAYTWDLLAIVNGGKPEKPPTVSLSHSAWHNFAVSDSSVCPDATALIDVPDEALRQALLELLGSEGSAPTCLEMQALTSLQVNGRGITDLEGLQYAVNLLSLAVYENQITDLSPVADLTDLLALYAHDNPVASLDPVAGLTKLQRIELSNNAVTSLAPLAGLDELIRVGAAHMPLVTDLSPLSGKPIQSLWLNGSSGIDDFSVIAEFTGLVHLLVGGTQFDDADLQMVSSFTALQRLQLWTDTGISDLSPLTGLPLTELDIGGTAVSDLSPVHGMGDTLAVFYAYALGLTEPDIAFLTDFPLLSTVWLQGNSLTGIAPLVDNPNISAGDFIDLRFNCLELADESLAMTQVAQLLDRGVVVDYEEQGGCEP